MRRALALPIVRGPPIPDTPSGGSFVRGSTLRSRSVGQGRHGVVSRYKGNGRVSLPRGRLLGRSWKSFPNIVFIPTRSSRERAAHPRPWREPSGGSFARGSTPRSCSVGQGRHGRRKNKSGEVCRFSAVLPRRSGGRSRSCLMPRLVRPTVAIVGRPARLHREVPGVSSWEGQGAVRATFSFHACVSITLWLLSPGGWRGPARLRASLRLN